MYEKMKNKIKCLKCNKMFPLTQWRGVNAVIAENAKIIYLAPSDYIWEISMPRHCLNLGLKSS